MDKVLKCLKALSDESRARIVMLLLQEELSVCELMAVLRIPQPLVSRHLSILKEADLVKNRREGKMHYYSLTDETIAGGKIGIIRLVADSIRSDARVREDRLRLRECKDFIRKTGRCDMESLRDFARQEVRS